MALNNRTELTELIDAWSPTIDLEITHKPNLKTLIESVVLKKQVANGVALSSPTESIDFTGYDYILGTTTAESYPIEVSITGVLLGEVKILKIDNTSGADWSLTGVTSETINFTTSYTETSALYIVTNYDGTVRVDSLLNLLEAASNTESLAGTLDTKYIVPSTLKYVVRTGYKKLSAGESYTVASGVGIIEVPSGVAGGSITLTDASAATSTGQVVEIYSTGGSGVTIYLEGDSDTSVISGKTLRYCANGSAWNRISNF